MHFVLLLEQLFDALTPSFKYALRLNQWKGARVLRQTNTRGCGYNSFFIIQSGQVSEGGAISVSWHVNYTYKLQFNYKYTRSTSCRKVFYYSLKCIY